MEATERLCETSIIAGEVIVEKLDGSTRRTFVSEIGLN